MAGNSFPHCLVFALTLAGLGACGTGPGKPGQDGGAPVVACVVGGCSGQLCGNADEDPLVSTCEWREEYACYRAAECAVQENGKCGWTPTDELRSCLDDAASPTDPVEPPDPVEKECQRSGCSGQVCIELDADPVNTTCEWREEYACYDAASCEKQSDGRCGWTPTAELTSCLEQAGSVAQ